MQISRVNIYNKPFKAATVSINALSDTHGELLKANSAIETMRKHKDDFFCREKKGSTNVTAICGDWFMNGGKKGFVSNQSKPLAMFQLGILNEFINQIKGMAGSVSTIFVPGNHEFDGGVELLDNVLSNLDADVVASNLDIEHSKGFSKTIESGKLFSEKVIEAEDDKNPNLKHKILFLGIMPTNMQAYQKNLDGVALTDVNKKHLAKVEKEDYQNTLDICKSKIEAFKKENPNGIVIFMSHAGAGFSDYLAQEAPVNLIFDGHEHKTQIRTVNSTPIIPLSQNFRRIVNAKLSIDDNGNLKEIRTKITDPSDNKTRGPILKLYRQLFKSDIVKKYSIKSNDKSISALKVDGVREGNSFLANFITDSILSELKKEDKDIDIFALNSSSIRHSLKVSNKKSVSNLDILNVLAGISEDSAKIYTNKVSGNELAYLVYDNLVFSRYNPDKRPIIHYSGLIIDRTSIYKAIDEGKPLSEILQYIKDAKTNKPIEADKTYKIANPEKYFLKSGNDKIKGMINSAEYTGFSVHELFQRHFAENKNNIFVNCDNRII